MASLLCARWTPKGETGVDRGADGDGAAHEGIRLACAPPWQACAVLARLRTETAMNGPVTVDWLDFLAEGQAAPWARRPRPAR